MIYPDTSFLVPLYTNEPFSAEAKGFMARISEPLIFTPFHRLELRTALRVRAFQGVLDRAWLTSALRQSEADLAEDILEHPSLDWSKALREAEQIAATHLIEVGARSGDLLHVASAVILKAEEFVTFDQRQTELARRAGLHVRPWPSLR